jgi:glycosyltransferase involved in cell wall biosynthesis
VRSDRIVCISNHVRGTLLASVDVRPDRVVTIPLGLLQDFQKSERGVVARLGLTTGDFLLYPANFWRHKNHRTLFNALRIYRQNHPHSHLKVVCTGVPNSHMRTLQVEADTLLPPGTVVFAGYVAPDELKALFEACRGLIFPSLYEGFGMPVLEAMAHEKPVLCSDVSSLPEVAGDAAIYFDPTDARAIASAIEALADDARIAVLVRRGAERAAALGSAREMAQRYVTLLQQVMAPSAV